MPKAKSIDAEAFDLYFLFGGFFSGYDFFLSQYPMSSLVHILFTMKKASGTALIFLLQLSNAFLAIFKIKDGLCLFENVLLLFDFIHSIL